MKAAVEVRCIVCGLVYCCADCRRRHEKIIHGLTYECPICRGLQFFCKPEQLNLDFIEHLVSHHTPLHCKKCYKIFKTMEDFNNIDECTSISELMTKEVEISTPQFKEVNEKFEALYEKVNNTDMDNIEGIISVNKNSKTAVITPVVRKQHLVDYESSESEEELKPKNATPYPKMVPKTPKLKKHRAATPHTKKLLTLMRQKVVEEYEETIGDENFDGTSDDKTTPSRTENNNIVLDQQKQMTTPTSHLPHLMKLAQAVTTSTPTHATAVGWPLFPDQGADSPLSEIENTESPAQSINKETSKTEHDAVPPKLKSIISTGSKIRIGSQDSSEKQVTFQDSNEVSIKKKVKFAEDTIFEQAKTKRVLRKPRRMLTPGPQKPKLCFNPRFQALINRFENGMTMARTPVTRDKNINSQESTPPVGEPSSIPARAINFKDDSPVVGSENVKVESDNELFKTCIDLPEANAITALTTNIVGGLQNCLSTVLMNTEEETEIQFKFIITKKKVSVKRLVEECERLDEKSSVIDRNLESNKENIWSSVARAVRNVFWGENAANFAQKTAQGFKPLNNSISKGTSPVSRAGGSSVNWDEKPSHSASVRVNGSWGLPAFVCDVYIAMDVTSSTSSIFNLVAISVDRYIAVTQPIKYAKHKNNRRVWFTIVLVWLISAAIGAPIVLGLNDTSDRNFDECLFNSQNYVIYSSLGSFYIPCIMMMFLYYNIFKALRNRAKKQRAAKKPPVSGDPTTGATTAVVIENVAQTRRLAETALHDDRPTNTGSGSNEDDHEDSFDKRSVDIEADADDCHVILNNKSTEFMLATVAEEKANTVQRNIKQHVPDPNGNNDSGYAPSNLEDTIREHVSPPGSPGLKDATVLKNMACDDDKYKKNGKSKMDSRNVSLQIRSEDDQLTASNFDLRDGSSSKKERKASAATARFTIYKANKASKKKREKSSAKKERKATKTLAIVLGVFLFCWAPFFTCSVLGAICDKIGLSFDPGVTVFILTTWLGYINSFLNPVIYTIFNPEFRKAFRKILHCGT